MAIAFDAVSSAETVPAGGATSLTWSHTLGSGQDPILVVGVSIRNNSSQQVSSVTYNGTALTKIDVVDNATYVRAELWYLPKASLPAPGTYDVVVNMTATARFVAGAFSLFNVDPTTPLGTFASNTGSGNPTWAASVDVPSASGEIVVGTLAKQYDDPVKPEQGQHQADRWNHTTNDASANNVLGVGTLRGGEAPNASPYWALGGTTNGQQWAIAGVSVKPTTEAAPQITTLTDYPLLYSVTDSDMQANVINANGWDIIFHASDDTTCGGAGLAPCILDHEIEKYDPATGKLVAWVRLPSVNGVGATSDTVIDISYGNTCISAPTANKTGVWDSNYMEVWHLSESSGDASDSTSNGYVAAVQADPGTPTHPDAKIGGGYQFAGDSWLLTNDGQFAVANAPLTIEGWFHIDSGTPSWVGIATKNRDVSCSDNPPYCDWAGVWIGGSGELTYAWDWHNQANIEGGAALSTGTWYYGAITFDGGIRTGFRNGLRDTVVTSPNPSPGTYTDMTMPTRMNKDLDGGGMMSGIIDEVRISTAARTPGWILSSYNNMNNPGDIGSPGFYTVGPQIDESCNDPFAYRRLITIDHNEVGLDNNPGSLTNFPALVSLSGSWLRTTIADPTKGRIEHYKGWDIVFRASDEVTHLDHEIEYYDGSASGGDVTRIDSWSTGTGDPTGPYTVPAGSNRLLVLVTALECSATLRTIDGVTFGTTPMTRAETTYLEGSPGNYIKVEIWYLKDADIPAGSQSFDISYSSAPTAALHAWATFENVDQINPLVHKNTGSDANPVEAAVDVVDGGMSVAGVICGIGQQILYLGKRLV